MGGDEDLHKDTSDNNKKVRRNGFIKHNKNNFEYGINSFDPKTNTKTSKNIKKNFDPETNTKSVQTAFFKKSNGLSNKRPDTAREFSNEFMNMQNIFNNDDMMFPRFDRMLRRNGRIFNDREMIRNILPRDFFDDETFNQPRALTMFYDEFFKMPTMRRLDNDNFFRNSMMLC